MLRMAISRQADQTIRYGITHGQRWIYILFCVFLGVGFASSAFSTSAIIPLAFFLLSLAGAGYRESWTFDGLNREVVYRIGFFFFIRKNTYPFDKISRIEVTHFVRGYAEGAKHARPWGRNKAMVVFSLRMSDDSVKDVEIIAERTSAGKTEAAAHLIAAEMNLPYKADREPDIVQQVSLRDL